MSVNSTTAINTVSFNGSLDNSTLTGTENIESSIDNACRDFFSILNWCFIGIIFIPGILGNIVSFVVFGKDGSNPAASLQLRALAVADTTLLIGWINSTVVFSYSSFFHSTFPGLVLSRLVDVILRLTAQTTTIWLTVVIAINRFIVVCLPLKARYLCSKARVCFQIASVVILSLLFNVPFWFMLKIVKSGDGKGSDYALYRVEWGNRDIYRRIYDITYEVVTGAVPLLLLVVFNTCIIVAHRRASRRRQQLQNMNRADRKTIRNEDSITRLMITVVLVFLICVSPQMIFWLIHRWVPACSLRGYIGRVLSRIKVSNSAVNFVIYFSILKNFRRTLKSCCLCHSNRRSSL